MWVLHSDILKCAPESVDSEKDLNEPLNTTSESELFAWAVVNAQDIRRPASWLGWKRRPWSRRLFGQAISNLSRGNRIVEKWMESSAASPAPISASPANEPESTAQDGSGLPCGALHAIFEWTGSAWRTYMGLFPEEDLPLCSMTLPLHGGLRNGCIYERARWAPAMSESDSSCWHTPCANDSEKRGDSVKGAMLVEQANNWPTTTAGDAKSSGAEGYPTETRHAGVTLTDAVSRWPTARSSDGDKGGPNQAGSKGDLMLPSAAAKFELWATPTASANSNRTTKRAPSHGETHGEVLAGQAASWLTPLAADDGHKVTPASKQAGLIGATYLFLPQDQTTPDGSESSTSALSLPQHYQKWLCEKLGMEWTGETKLRLNPIFTCWLMAFPHNYWTSADPMPSALVETHARRFRLRLRSLLCFVDWSKV